GNDEEEAINLEESVERYAIRRRPGGQQVASSSNFWSQRYQPSSSSSFDRSGNNERTSARDCYVSLQIECSRNLHRRETQALARRDIDGCIQNTHT
ncbi:hypothetical protein V1477_010354, partial [Vespula maculifrons]